MKVSLHDLPLPIAASELGLPLLEEESIADGAFDYVSYYDIGLLDLNGQMSQLVREFKDQFVRPWVLYLTIYRRNGIKLVAWRHGANNSKVRLDHELARAHLASISRSAQSIHYDFERRRLHLNARATLLFQLREFCRRIP